MNKISKPRMQNFTLGKVQALKFVRSGAKRRPDRSADREALHKDEQAKHEPTTIRRSHVLNNQTRSDLGLWMQALDALLEGAIRSVDFSH